MSAPRRRLRSALALSSGAVVFSGAMLGFGSPLAVAATTTSGLVRAYPVRVGGSGAAAGVDLLVPYATGLTGVEGSTDAASALVVADFTRRSLASPELRNLTCSVDIAPEECREPFSPLLLATQEAPGWDRSASFDRPATDADSSPTARLQATIGSDRRSFSEASSPGGALRGYLSFETATARGEARVDESGRVVTVARAELSGVVIGPNGEIRAEQLRTIASSGWVGSEAAREPRASVEVDGLIILDQPVELTPQGLRLRQGAPSEQEAYDGARVLLLELASRGIAVEAPVWGIDRSGGGVAARAQGFRVRFEQAVTGGPVEAPRLVYEIELGSSSASIAPGVLSRPRATEGGSLDVFSADLGLRRFESPAAQPAPAGSVERSAGNRRSRPGSPDRGESEAAAAGAVEAGPAPPTGEPSASFPPESVGERPTQTSAELSEIAAPTLGPSRSAESRRAARSVSGAFGAFLGLALVLPIARVIIRRLA